MTTARERRRFLRQVFGCAAGALTLGCLAGIDASGRTVSVSATAQGDERRYPLPEADGVTIDQTSSVMLVRYQGKVLALALACPHQRAAVKWLPERAAFPVLQARLEISAERHLHLGTRHPQPRSLSDSSRRASGRDRRQQDLQVRSGRRRLGGGGRFRLSERDAVIGMRVPPEYRIHVAAAMLWATTSGFFVLHAQQASPVPSSAPAAMAATATGEDIYRAACVTCHGPDGRGAPRATVGFDTPLPDFTDCAFATAEADADWIAVVHQGGRIRGLSRRMPAFGDALTTEQIAAAVGHVRLFCSDRAWPRGDLNFPSRHLHRKGVPRERSGPDERDHSRHGTGRRQ